MKRNKVFLAILIVAMLATVACAGFLKTNYRVLYTSNITYTTARQAVADLYEQGLINEEQRVEINRVAKIYHDAHNAYEDALVIYVKTDSAANKEKIKVVLAEVAARWKDFASLVNAIKPGLVPESILK